ncbi:hypothetical protein ACM66T_10075 [Sulfurimonas sp. ST-25]|uniref:hypothetical protein n=1 Tax=Sulfurimonas sp. ST-25 TaxID=3400151 RepID=UPI003A84B358
MAKKCSYDGLHYYPCDNIGEAIRGVNGDSIGLTIRAVYNFEHELEYNSGLILKWGRKRTDMAIITYCPACGENIVPRYNDCGDASEEHA